LFSLALWCWEHSEVKRLTTRHIKIDNAN